MNGGWWLKIFTENNQRIMRYIVFIIILLTSSYNAIAVKPQKALDTNIQYHKSYTKIIFPLISSTKTSKLFKDKKNIELAKAVNNSKNNWNISDKIAVGALIAAVLQFLALLFTLTTTRNNNQRQLRAYVFVDNGSIFDGGQLKVKPLIDRTNQPGFSLIVRNSGQTPAYHFVHLIKMVVEDIQNESNLDTSLTSLKISGTHISPHGVINYSQWLDRPLTEEEINGIRNRTKAIFVYGKINYVDAFKKKRFTTYRLKYNGFYPPLDGATFYFCDEGNDAN